MKTLTLLAVVSSVAIFSTGCASTSPQTDGSKKPTFMETMQAKASSATSSVTSYFGEKRSGADWKDALLPAYTPQLAAPAFALKDGKIRGLDLTGDLIFTLDGAENGLYPVPVKVSYKAAEVCIEHEYPELSIMINISSGAAQKLENGATEESKLFKFTGKCNVEASK